VRVRDATPGDAAALAAIYGHHVLNGVGTFEETPPSAEEMVRRQAAVRALGLPYLVAEAEEGPGPDRILGFAYAAPFRPRAAYRFTAEDSVYVAPGRIGRGVGRALVAEVVARCEALGLRQLVAVIGGSDNTASIGLHRALGFEMQGVMPALGFKHGRWVDVVSMQKPLNGGANAPPSGPGLDLRGG
jgi:L-amino acid N-acyltransferase YncA